MKFCLASRPLHIFKRMWGQLLIQMGIVVYSALLLVNIVQDSNFNPGEISLLLFTISALFCCCFSFALKYIQSSNKYEQIISVFTMVLITTGSIMSGYQSIRRREHENDQLLVILNPFIAKIFCFVNSTSYTQSLKSENLFCSTILVLSVISQIFRVIYSSSSAVGSSIIIYFGFYIAVLCLLYYKEELWKEEIENLKYQLEQKDNKDQSETENSQQFNQLLGNISHDLKSVSYYYICYYYYYYFPNN
jgi:hypothetical protein